MAPKFIEVTKRVDGKPSHKVMVNPRRVDYFTPSDHKDANSPANLAFGRGEYLCVMESVAQIKTLLNK